MINSFVKRFEDTYFSEPRAAILQRELLSLVAVFELWQKAFVCAKYCLPNSPKLFHISLLFIYFEGMVVVYAYYLGYMSIFLPGHNEISLVLVDIYQVLQNSNEN